MSTETPISLSALGRRGCQCIGCLRFFWGVAAFDAHRRKATAAELAEDSWMSRRCMTDAEIAKAGLTADERGVWFDATGRQKASNTRSRTVATQKVA